MASFYFIYVLWPLVLTSALSSNYIRLWKKPHLEPTSYESIEFGLPYVPSKLSDRTNLIKEQLEKKDRLVTLFTHEKKEVKDAEAFLSEMLRVLHHLFSKKPVAEVSNKPVSKESGSDSIAWSYYDDLGK